MQKLTKIFASRSRGFTHGNLQKKELGGPLCAHHYFTWHALESSLNDSYSL